MSDTAPAWLQPVTLEEWPTQFIEHAALRYAIPLPQGWDTKPLVSQTNMEREHIYRGAYSPELLAVSFMDNADPAANMRNWVEAAVAMTGLPPLPIVWSGDQAPRVLGWQYHGADVPLTERLGLNETHAYSGVVTRSGKPADLARIYVLLARRGTWAWKVSLSLMSACPPGTLEKVVVENDHVRAGAVFGHLRFL